MVFEIRSYFGLVITSEIVHKLLKLMEIARHLITNSGGTSRLSSWVLYYSLYLLMTSLHASLKHQSIYMLTTQ